MVQEILEFYLHPRMGIYLVYHLEIQWLYLKHQNGTTTESFISFAGEVNGAVMDSNNNIFLISKIVDAGSDEVIFKYSISGTGGLLSTPGLSAVIGGGSSIIESITIDSAENLYIGVSLDSVNSSRIIKLFADSATLRMKSLPEIHLFFMTIQD